MINYRTTPVVVHRAVFAAEQTAAVAAKQLFGAPGESWSAVLKPTRCRIL